MWVLQNEVESRIVIRSVEGMQRGVGEEADREG